MLRGRPSSTLKIYEGKLLTFQKERKQKEIRFVLRYHRFLEEGGKAGHHPANDQPEFTAGLNLQKTVFHKSFRLQICRINLQFENHSRIKSKRCRPNK